MLKITTVSIIVMFLASALILPVGMSYAVTSNVTASMSVKTMSNQTKTNQTMTQPTMSNQTKTNQTMTQPTPSTVSQTNNTKGAQQVSDFIHQAVADFKQQGVDTRQVMLDCRDKLQTAGSSDVDKIRADCTTQLSTIKAKYQDERNHFHDLIKQYRQSVMVFLMDARGMTVDKATMDKAVTNLSMMMNMAVPSGGVKGLAATTNNTHCVNPPGGPAIC